MDKTNFIGVLAKTVLDT